MWLGAYVERVIGRRLHVWSGECHVHAGIRPKDISHVRETHPGAEFLIHPECGCTTQVMEYVAAGDVDAEHTHMLSTGGMLQFARSSDAEEFIVATETGMLHPLERENPGKRFIAANRAAVCRYMKMITYLVADRRRPEAPGQRGPGDCRARPRADRAHGGDQPRRRAPGAGWSTARRACAGRLAPCTCFAPSGRARRGRARRGAEARRAGFEHRPYLVLNMVSSLDGRATIDWRTKGLSTELDRLFHHLRTQVDAAMVGAGTARIERHGRITKSAELREKRVCEGLRARPAGGRRLRPPRPARGLAAAS